MNTIVLDGGPLHGVFVDAVNSGAKLPDSVGFDRQGRVNFASWRHRVGMPLQEWQLRDPSQASDIDPHTNLYTRSGTIRDGATVFNFQAVNPT